MVIVFVLISTAPRVEIPVAFRFFVSTVFPTDTAVAFNISFTLS